MKTVSIVLISDTNYVMPTAVVVESIKKNKNPDTKYDINIIAVECSVEEVETLRSLDCDGVSVKVFESESIYKNIGQTPGHVTKSALLKFNIANMFSDLDKVLYLDSDIIVQNDLSELFSFDVSDCYAAVSKDLKAIKINNDYDGYFNSGVMLLNLKRIREDNLREKFIETKKIVVNRFQDQDVFNIVFKDNVKYISARYNYLTRYEDFFTVKDIEDFYKDEMSDISILHFTYKKPWEYSNVTKQKIWQEYYDLSVYKDKKLVLQELEKEVVSQKLNDLTYHDKVVELVESGVTKVKRDCKIIVSLTTFPARIELVHKSIRTILSQTFKPDEVVLWLSVEEFPQKEAMLPKSLLELKNYGLSIDWCHNLKSYNKLVYSLEKYPNDIIITVDDDIFYKPDTIEKLVNAYQNAGCSNNKIYAHRVHKISFNGDDISKYNKWKQEIISSETSFNNFLTGVGGVLYPPKCLYKDVLNKDLFLKLSPSADDIWFWAMGVMNDVRVEVVKEGYRKLEYISRSQDIGLCKQNCNLGMNDIQLNNVLKHYPQIQNKLEWIPEYNPEETLRYVMKKNKKTAVFWGASLFLEEILKQDKFDNILGIIDKNSAKHGMKMGCYTIYSPNDLSELKPEVVMFSIKHYNRDIYPQVEEYLKTNYPDIKLFPNVFE